MSNLKVIKGGKRIEKGSILGNNIEIETNIPKDLFDKMLDGKLNKEEFEMLDKKGMLDFTILE